MTQWPTMFSSLACLTALTLQNAYYCVCMCMRVCCVGEGMGVGVCVRQFTCQPALLCCRCLPWIDTLIVFVMLLHEQVSKTFTEQN